MFIGNASHIEYIEDEDQIQEFYFRIDCNLVLVLKQYLSYNYSFYLVFNLFRSSIGPTADLLKVKVPKKWDTV